MNLIEHSCMWAWIDSASQRICSKRVYVIGKGDSGWLLEAKLAPFLHCSMNSTSVWISQQKNKKNNECHAPFHVVLVLVGSKHFITYNGCWSEWPLIADWFAVQGNAATRGDIHLIGLMSPAHQQHNSVSNRWAQWNNHLSESGILTFHS